MIRIEHIRQARETARTTKQAWDQVLCQSMGCDATQLLEDLGTSFGYPVLRLDLQTAWDFNTEMLELPQARKFMALVLRQADSHWLVFADPADERLQACWKG